MEIILYEAKHLHEAPHLHETPRFPKRKLSLPAFSPVKAKRTLRFAGYILMVVSFLIFAISFGPVIGQEISFRFHRQPAATLPTGFRRLTENQRQKIAAEAEKYGVSTDFSIVIPKISAAAKVIPNVNPADENDYKAALMQGVGHAAGTKFPGDKGIIYLFAHSTNSPLNISRYNAVFYLLKELNKGDEVVIFFAGQKYTYQVTERFVTEPEDTKWLTEKKNEELLVLQTCWPPGTSQKRLLILAKPI